MRRRTDPLFCFGQRCREASQGGGVGHADCTGNEGRAGARAYTHALQTRARHTTRALQYARVQARATPRGRAQVTVLAKHASEGRAAVAAAPIAAKNADGRGGADAPTTVDDSQVPDGGKG